MQKLSLLSIDFQDKRALLRVDFNVPLTNGQMSADPYYNTRIVEALPTINYVLDHGGSVVLISHLGRPGGFPNSKYSLAAIVPELSRLLGRAVEFLNDCVGPEVEERCSRLKPGEVLLLENLRFHLEEEGKGVDPKTGEKASASKSAIAAFSASLSKLADVFVNDAFGTAHRDNTSMVGVTLGTRVSGFLMAKELAAFSKCLEHPESPFLLIMGGSKLGDKMPLIENLLQKGITDLIIGGAMAFTFLATTGMKIGKSLYDQPGAALVPHLHSLAARYGVKIHLPVDFVCADKFAADAPNITTVTEAEGVPEGFLGLDIGPVSSQAFSKVVLASKTILWNGPAGVFEMAPFANGTKVLMEAVAQATKTGATSVIGGGDTGSACHMFGFSTLVTHVSTGGGVSLELLEGKVLPGVAALNDAPGNGHSAPHTAVLPTADAGHSPTMAA
jgi:phosphoglycerate kinase